jgi:predicted neutral ceramidase superfamily lipid hydrolase
LSPSKVISEVANQPIFDEYIMFIIKVIIFVIAIALISTVICLLNTQIYSWIAQSFIVKLIAGINALGLKATEFMGLAKLKTLSFSDSLGNEYDVLISTNNAISI